MIPPGRSKWLDWEPGQQALHISPSSAVDAPTKPTEPGPDAGFDGFVGATTGESPTFQSPQRSLAAESEGTIRWSRWKARALNELFREQGVTGQRGKIKADTVEHGEAKRCASGVRK